MKMWSTSTRTRLQSGFRFRPCWPFIESRPLFVTFNHFQFEQSNYSTLVPFHAPYCKSHSRCFVKDDLVQEVFVQKPTLQPVSSKKYMLYYFKTILQRLVRALYFHEGWAFVLSCDCSFSLFFPSGFCSQNNVFGTEYEYEYYSSS